MDTEAFVSLRKEASVSQEELATELGDGMDQRVISTVERTAPSVPDAWPRAVRSITAKRLERLAEAVGA
jgi:transcriptional regulator with XRE-family HTH domain